jgi:two-component sensor histidine kinase
VVKTSARDLKPNLLVTLVVIIAAVFIADINLPLGIAGGVPYAAAVLVAIRAGNKRFVITVAVICTFLTVVGFFFSPGGGELWKVEINRFLAVLVIWVSVYLGMKLRIAEDKLEMRANEYQVLFGQNEEHRKMIAERDVLLQEVYHRVKNNLALIASMLDLQTFSDKNIADHAPFIEAKNRILTMAIVHKKLYQSDDFNNVDFGAFIIELAGLIRESYAQAGKNVKVKFDISNHTITINQAILCGLILNELVSNAFKHAFPDGREGQITIKFQMEDRVTLIVEDNGVGIFDTQDPENPATLGLQIVHLLTDQLNGNLEIVRNHGSVFKLSF